MPDLRRRGRRDTNALVKVQQHELDEEEPILATVAGLKAALLDLAEPRSQMAGEHVRDVVIDDGVGNPARLAGKAEAGGGHVLPVFAAQRAFGQQPQTLELHELVAIHRGLEQHRGEEAYHSHRTLCPMRLAQHHAHDSTHDEQPYTNEAASNNGIEHVQHRIMCAQPARQSFHELHRFRSYRTTEQRGDRRELHETLALVCAFDRDLARVDGRRIRDWQRVADDARVGFEEQPLGVIERLHAIQRTTQYAQDRHSLVRGENVDVHVALPSEEVSMDGRITAAAAARTVMCPGASPAAREVIRRRERQSPRAGAAVLEAEEALVRLFEERERALNTPCALGQRLRVPFAAWDGEEIPAIDMDGPCQFLDRVAHRMDDVAR